VLPQNLIQNLCPKEYLPGERYIFCAENITYIELVNRIATALGRRPIRGVLPAWTLLPVSLAFGLKDILPKHKTDNINLMTREILKESYFYKYYNSDKAKNELDWQPKVFLEGAVLKAIDFYKKEKLI
ncbi:hypothetical protein ACFL0T_02945, partial [Candidatus Omnitrophota bacterium]